MTRQSQPLSLSSQILSIANANGATKNPSTPPKSNSIEIVSLFNDSGATLLSTLYNASYSERLNVLARGEDRSKTRKRPVETKMRKKPRRDASKSDDTQQDNGIRRWEAIDSSTSIQSADSGLPTPQTPRLSVATMKRASVVSSITSARNISPKRIQSAKVSRKRHSFSGTCRPSSSKRPQSAVAALSAGSTAKTTGRRRHSYIMTLANNLQLDKYEKDAHMRSSPSRSQPYCHMPTAEELGLLRVRKWKDPDLLNVALKTMAREDVAAFMEESSARPNISLNNSAGLSNSFGSSRTHQPSHSTPLNTAKRRHSNPHLHATWRELYSPFFSLHNLSATPVHAQLKDRVRQEVHSGRGSGASQLQLSSRKRKSVPMNSDPMRPQTARRRQSAAV